MDSREIMKLFDSCWFEMEIFKKQICPSTSFEPNPDGQIEENSSVASTRITGRKKGISKNLPVLEFEELKGFMDLGFVFSEEDNKDSRLVKIIAGLQILGKKEGEEESKEGDNTEVSRPYLSEAWEVSERRRKENPLMKWRVPTLGNEIYMKYSLRWWAHSVASTIR
ncbi:hypothetical protein CRYUN_Cryun34aG0038200 [Craigia yunnanensis]